MYGVLGCPGGGADGRPLACNGGAPATDEIVVRDGPRLQPLPQRPAARRLPVARPPPRRSTGAAALAGAVVDARVLIITADGTAGELAAIRATLQYLGTPFDVLDATHDPPLTADRLATGTHGKYQAIFLDLGGLEVSGGSAFTSDEWTTLATYEAQFGAPRRALHVAVGDLRPVQHGAGRSVEDAGHDDLHGARCLGVRGTNCANPIVMNAGWAYPAAATDGATAPLLTDAAGKIYAAVRTYPDGREALALTFAQATYLDAVPAARLRIGELGDARPVRGRAARLRCAADRRSLPGQRNLHRRDVPHHGRGHAGAGRLAGAGAHAAAVGRACVWPGRPTDQGSQSRPGDPLTAKAVALGGAFAWINHTWDHPILDNQTYADALQEFTRNDTYLRGLGLTPYASMNAVTPNVSGLASADAMRAIADAGIRQIVGNTSIAGEDNPSPNVGVGTRCSPRSWSCRACRPTSASTPRSRPS